MIYLTNFTLGPEQEILEHSMNVYNSYYPLGLFSNKGLSYLTFEPITIFCGNNGSGKTTLLHLIAKTLHASSRHSLYFGDLFERYVTVCEAETDRRSECGEIKVISSDDVFDSLLDMRAINERVDRRKDSLAQEYLSYKYGDTVKGGFEQYEDLKNQVDARRMTVSKYIRSRLSNNTILQYSNGETALDFWQSEIKENGLYLLDEPENSLSAENQLKLKKYIEESARFFNCQFIISTHSPFLLSLKGAKIYDLDKNPVDTSRFEDLPNVRITYEFFKEHEKLFEKE